MVGYSRRCEIEMVSIEKAERDMAHRARAAEKLIALERPELIELFFTYQNEAVAARRFLDSNLVNLEAGSEILEVGGGILALAIQLASEGFKVTTVEPIGEGFSGISFIMNIFSEIARKEKLIFTLIESPIEDCKFNSKFDFIFSINVMEHLKNPYSVSLQMRNELKPSGIYRLFCPNYDFPYEPHFGKWMFVRRSGSFHLNVRAVRRGNIMINEPQNLYQSINFVTLRKLSKFFRKNDIEYIVNRHALYELIERSTIDTHIQSRHPKLYPLVRLANKIKLIKISKLFPVRYQPIIDVSISRKLESNLAK